VTQKQIGEINLAYTEKEAAKETYDNKCEVYTLLMRDVRRTCDHRYPDNKSAIFGGFEYSHCKICGDLF